MAASQPPFTALQNFILTYLLGSNTHSASTTTSGLGVLTTNTETEGVTNTTVGTDLLQAFHIFTELVVESVRQELAVLAILAILLTIEEPVWDLVLTRVLHDGDDAFKVSIIDFTSALAHVNFSLAADETSVTATATFDGSQGELNLLLTVNVGVEDTQNVLERGLFRNVQRLKSKMKNLKVKMERKIELVKMYEMISRRKGWIDHRGKE